MGKKKLAKLDLPIQPTRRAFGWFEAPNEIYDMEKLPSFYIEVDGKLCYGFPNAQYKITTPLSQAPKETP